MLGSGEVYILSVLPYQLGGMSHQLSTDFVVFHLRNDHSANMSCNIFRFQGLRILNGRFEHNYAKNQLI